MADDIRTCRDLEGRLTPYVDGGDAPEARLAVEQHLRACPSCDRAARDERTARAIVGERRAALAEHAPAPLRARCEQSAAAFRLPAPSVAGSGQRASFARRWVPLSLAATLVLAVAGVFLFGLNDRVQALAASLAVDHVKCFKVNGTAADADAHAAERAWQDDQGWPIVVPRSDPSQQLRLVGVRRCLSSDGRVAHLMYTWGGEPLSIYVLQSEAGRDEIAHQMGAQEVLWRANRRTYAVVSGDTTRDLSRIVDYIKGRVQ